MLADPFLCHFQISLSLLRLKPMMFQINSVMFRLTELKSKMLTTGFAHPSFFWTAERGFGVQEILI